MIEINDNRRVRYTKMVLRESLIELLKEKPINRITVTDICKQADLNRGTFYNYYCDAFDLLAQIEEELYQELMDVTMQFNDNGVSGDLLVDILTCIEKNRDFCYVLLNLHGDQTFVSRLLEMTRVYTFRYWNENNINNLTQEQMDLLYTFFANGSVGVLSRWLKGDWKVSKEYIAKTLLALGMKGAEYFFNEGNETLPIIKLKSSK